MATKLPRVYGDLSRFKATLGSHINRGRDLLDQAEGVRKRVATTPRQRLSLEAFAAEREWARDVEGWRGNVVRFLERRLADGPERVLPIFAVIGPREGGAPLDSRDLDRVEPWLRKALDDLVGLRGRFGVSKNLSSVSPLAARFAELRNSGLVDAAVIEGYAKDMKEPKTAKQLGDAIGAAKELTEATLRAALDRLGVSSGHGDQLSRLMKKWRGAVAAKAPPDPAAGQTLDRAQAALGSLVVFLAEWRNEYGRGRGRPRYPPGLKPRHARLAVDGAETAVRFIVSTMDDLSLLPP